MDAPPGPGTVSAMACVKCGSAVDIDGVRIVSPAYPAGVADLKALVFAQPDALILKEAVAVSVAARICVGCGYIELYASDPGKLVAAVDRANAPSDPGE